MEFDIRYLSYTFKHSYSPVPDLSQPRFQEHYHTLYELLYFVQGDATFVIQNNRYKVQPGSLLVTKPGEYHQIIFNSPMPYERYVIRFSPLSLLGDLTRLMEQTQSVYDISNTPIAAEFSRMDAHLDQVQENLRLNACIGSLNLILSYLVSSQNLTREADFVNTDCKKIMDYIDAHLTEIHSVEDLSRALHMSRSTIYRIFGEQLNTRLMTYVRTQKCLLARTLIQSGQSPTEVASSLGFNHYSSFYRDYRSIFHHSPAKINRETKTDYFK